MRADYLVDEALKHVLAALTAPNRLAMEVSLSTGLRIGDVLSLPSEGLQARMTVSEHKTGKTRRIYFPVDLLERMKRQAGKVYVFPGARDPDKKHRTRQAVFSDLKRAAKLFRVREVHLSPHSARKGHAVNLYKKTGDLGKVQKALNHENMAVTILYAMADILTQRCNTPPARQN